MATKVIIFPTLESFQSCQNPLPSGQIFCNPVPANDGIRYAMCMDWVQMDLDYFTTLEGVTIADTLPADWYIPEED